MGKNGAWLAGLSGLYHVSVLGNNLLPLEGIALARGWWWCMHASVHLMCGTCRDGAGCLVSDCAVSVPDRDGPQGHSILPRAMLTCAAYKADMCCPPSLEAAKHQQA
ncbi:hypothetical protein COCSADRAFT_168476 [Bipolaris sorokiniana ND90Pr]|uniref:Uncharacterized protein n=1 Tax=Cochliobolus sativus (strain ND90Pr / ATCC 201652) TaxID=665912 RepID=M2SJ83_COCSN|nr:uncharacterized protein COCSADRAFT_168476 [Bipolaris sorokiniana ND90Pr]EMD67253.1 hypothetical protein COCSADRAFT_168476 [Bipolaris sorokiniana ND90Pr]